jgi:glucose-6-phosphate 1-epimerase
MADAERVLAFDLSSLYTSSDSETLGREGRMALENSMDISIPGIVSRAKGRGGLDLIKVCNDFAEAEIFLYAANIAHFQPKGRKPLLWMSPRSPFEEGKNLRGGVPICWPWFGPNKSNKAFPMHGFARNRVWTPESAATLADGRTRISLILKDDEGTKALWDHAFSLRMTYTIGTGLEMELECENTGLDPFRYEDSLHTYFAVGNVGKVKISGLDGIPFFDKSSGGIFSVGKGILSPERETDHVYFGRDLACTVEDLSWGRRIFVEHSGTQATVVWNPWIEGGARIAEIGEAWPGFVCVEAANCLQNPVQLLPGTIHKTRARYRVEES